MKFPTAKALAALAAGGMITVLTAGPVAAADDAGGLVYRADLTELNDSGATGSATFTVSEDGTTMDVEITADGFDLDGPHAMHLHGHHFVDPARPGVWRDTALFDRGEQGSMQFVADNPGKWLLHCHMVEHMSGGMMTWFEVT